MSDKVRCIMGCGTTIPDIPEDAEVEARFCDRCLKIKEVRDARKNDFWSEYEEYPIEDWKNEVANGDTRNGYWEWVEAQIESEY